MKEIYVLSQMVYNNCEETYSEILGGFADYKEAEKEMLKLTQESVKDYNFVIDEECNAKTYDLKEIMTRLFYHHQENWDNYIEIKINRIILK